MLQLLLMNPKALDLLEFPRIRAALAASCGFSISKELAEALEPSADAVVVAGRLTLTSEAVHVLNSSPNLTTGGARDIRPAIERGRRGGMLDPQEFLSIQATISAGRTVRNTVVRQSGQAPGLADIAGLIRDCPDLEREISRCIGETGEVLDSASPELGRLRADIRAAHQRLLDKLHDIVHGGTYKNVLQEPLITMREGRYVVPVRSDSRGQLRGLIHDQSSSGQTVYVEPLVTVELTNRWRQLQLEEQHEVERILRRLSGMVGENADKLDATVVALGEIDLNLAKGRLAEMQRAVEPLLEVAPKRRSSARQQSDPNGSSSPSPGLAPTDDALGDRPRGLRLINARHPLLKGNVVPINLRLGDDFRVMVITGPNTGGKTVALKTAGLLTLMAQAGLHIPATSGSQIRVFDDILADIGDEQSIEQSLSTFSSHMRNVVGIVNTAGENTLALLDEVGAGTDPAEGSALARAILKRLLDTGAWVIATTHYTELKAFAHDTPGMTNASVEFNAETLAPTYRLDIGLPGKSNALAIAGRLGLNSEVLADARGMLDSGQIQVENLVAGLQAERMRADEILADAETERQAARRLREDLVERLRRIEDERREVLRRARHDAEVELADLRAQLRQAAATLQRQSTSGRGELVAVAQAVEAAGRQVLAKPLPGTAPANVPSVQTPTGTGAWTVGDTVRVMSLDQEGRITSLFGDGDTVEVQLGNFKLRTSRDDVEWLGRSGGDAPTTAYPSGPSIWSTSQRAVPELQLDLRGWRAEQVAPELDRYLNDAYAAGLPSVRIVHGKGTGVLRQVVREHLAKTRLVDHFELADQRDGGEGVTIAWLAL
jgi:DNA mismatch repair protein MutS2